MNVPCTPLYASSAFASVTAKVPRRALTLMGSGANPKSLVLPMNYRAYASLGTCLSSLVRVLPPIVLAAVACGGGDGGANEAASNVDATVTGTGGGAHASGTPASGGRAATAASTKPATSTVTGGGSGSIVSTLTGGTSAGTSWTEPRFDPNSQPADISSVEILVAADALEALDAAPFYGGDVSGAFVDADGKRYEGIDVNYRGAYALAGLIRDDPLGRRNWKLKFSSEERYRQRREWNYTFSPDLRQVLAYDLMRFAGVRVPSARHVRLLVNGEAHGLYLEYEDPDNKDWLWEMFGDKQGDLYKAALDLPPSEGQPDQKYFADTTYLGADDVDYPNHYNKKTNHEDPAVANDYAVVRAFLEQLNALPDSEFEGWLESHLRLDEFLSYLVVSNFISNWDSFPQRPKNFWLYELRTEGKLAFIPWDLDATFQQFTTDFNQMGTQASVFFNLRKLDYEPVHPQEGTRRPLAWRIMASPKFEAAYVARYRELTSSILSESYLTARIEALAALTEPMLTDALTGERRSGPTTERSDFEEALEDMLEFVTARSAAVTSELATIE